MLTDELDVPVTEIDVGTVRVVTPKPIVPEPLAAM